MRFLFLRVLRGFSTVEVMIMLVAISIVVIASYTAKQSTYQSYREIVHRERAQLFLTETFEALEAMRLTAIQQNYQDSWKDFLGELQGDYKLVKNISDPGYKLELVTNPVFDDTDTNLVKIYENENNLDGIYTRLERRIRVSTLPGAELSEPGVYDQKLVNCSIYWGVSGNFQENMGKQIDMEVLYSDDTGPAFVL